MSSSFCFCACSASTRWSSFCFSWLWSNSERTSNRFRSSLSTSFWRSSICFRSWSLWPRRPRMMPRKSSTANSLSYLDMGCDSCCWKPFGIWHGRDMLWHVVTCCDICALWSVNCEMWTISPSYIPTLLYPAPLNLPASHRRSLPFFQDRELFQHGFSGSLPPLLAIPTRVETNGLPITFCCNLSIWLLLHIGRQFFVNIVKDLLSTWQSGLNGYGLMDVPKVVVHPKMALGNKESGEIYHLCQWQSFFHLCLGLLNFGFCCRFTMIGNWLDPGRHPSQWKRLSLKIPFVSHQCHILCW